MSHNSSLEKFQNRHFKVFSLHQSEKETQQPSSQRSLFKTARKINNLIGDDFTAFSSQNITRINKPSKILRIIDKKNRAIFNQQHQYQIQCISNKENSFKNYIRENENEKAIECLFFLYIFQSFWIYLSLVLTLMINNYQLMRIGQYQQLIFLWVLGIKQFYSQISADIFAIQQDNFLWRSGFYCNQVKQLKGLPAIRLDRCLSKKQLILFKLNFKALQYAWLIGDKEYELKCYDELGVLKFLDREVEESCQLHEKQDYIIQLVRASRGQYEPEDSLLKAISKKDLDSYISKLPDPIRNVDGTLMSKSFNFPFKLVPCTEEKYYKDNIVTNQYLIHEKLMCVKSGRIINSTLEADEILNEIVKDKDFQYEFPTPVEQNFVFIKVKESLSSQFGKRMPKLISKSDRKFNLAMVSPDHLHNTQVQLSGTFKLDFDCKKQQLQQLVEERVKQKFNLQKTYSKVYQQQII